MNAVKEAMSKVQIAVGVKEEADTKSFLHQVDEAATMSWKTVGGAGGVQDGGRVPEDEGPCVCAP